MGLTNKFSVFNKVYLFLKEPFEVRSKEPITLKDFLLLLLFSFLFGFLISKISTLFIPEGLLEHKFDDIFYDNKILFLILGVFLAPLVEEITFRLSQSIKVNHILLSFGTSLFFIGHNWFFMILLWLFLFYLFMNTGKKSRPSLKFVVHFSSLIFAFIHLDNYVNFDLINYYYLLPILLCVQFTIGLLLSFIRLIHGIFWAILFHGVYNAILILTTIYFY